MVQDDMFEPKLGKIRSQRLKVPKGFRARVLKASHRNGGPKMPGVKRSPSASKRGRGSGVARVVSSGAKRGAGRRRVIVKARYMKLAGKGLKAATAHLKYIQRDGVTREGAPGQMYGAATERADGAAFMERSAEDKVQFRFIVAPEDADQYPDLKAYTRRLMAQMEEDLGTKLDWVAVDHFNTGHPHTHIVVRGQDENGNDLVIAREYISQGLRERAEAQVELDLGPVSDHERAARSLREVQQERMTSLDRGLLRDADEHGQVSAGLRDPQAQALRVGRLNKLDNLGLAEQIEPGRWQLRPDMEDVLRRLGERGDIIKMMQHELKARSMEHAIADSQIHDSDPAFQTPQKPIVGRVLKRGEIDGGCDRHYLMIDGVDGRVHMVDIGEADRTGPLGGNAIVRVAMKVPHVRPADRTIAEVAASNGGYYDVEAHLAYDPSARQAFAETHVRRLEAIRRTTGAVDREADGRFRIGSDYLEKALAFEQREARLAPVRIDVVSNQPLDRQVRRQGLTWLDQELASADGAGVAGAGFGSDVRDALQGRRQWLVEQELAAVDGDGSVTPKPGFAEALHRREMEAVAGELSKASGLAYREAVAGERVEGVLRQPVMLGAGKYAMVERSKEFTLVPWRPVLDDHVGKVVSGILRDGGINWSIGRGKGLGID